MVLKSTPPEYPTQRLLLGVIALILGLVAIAGRLAIGFPENTGIWVSGAFGKVAMLLGVGWLAWPQLMWLKRSEYGMISLVGIGIASIVFVTRPRLLLYFIPLLVAAVGLLIGITWLQRFFSPPKR